MSGSRHSLGVPSSGRVSGVIVTNERFENFIDDNDEWFSDIELRAIDLEKELSEWRESRARELAAQRRESEREAAEPARGRTAAARMRPRPAARPAWPIPDDGRRRARDRTGALIDRGRRTARPRRSRRGRTIAVASAAGLVVLVIGAMIVFRHGPSWPPSVATVKSGIATACQNPNVVSEPSQVNFACDQD